MSDPKLDEALAEIVRQRKARLPDVQRRLQRLDRVDQALSSIRDAASDLPESWRDDPEVRDALRRLHDGHLVASLPDARKLLEGVKGRFERETVNIGVSGRARVGKSRMLQTVSGLTGEQIPTGEDANVTAVRSRIFHASRPMAHLTFHDERSFLEETIHPYYRDLHWSPLPQTLPEFAAADLENMASQGRQTAGAGVEVEDLVARLRDIQKGLVGLRLDGGQLVLHDLSDLRRYVAYPRTPDLDKEDQGISRAPRDYLGVRDCRIETPFPVTAVERLGMVDLPGLGEVASGIDQRIMEGLRGDVDAVLVVFRAQVGLTNIDQIDIRAMDLIRQAQGAVTDSRDFGWLVVNAGPGDDERRSALVSQLQRRLNHREPDSRHLVLTANAMDQDSMHRDVLVPVLGRLSNRLSEMDHDLLRHAVEQTSVPLGELRQAAAALLEAIRSVQGRHPSIRIQLDDLSEDLRRDVQQSLRAVKPYRLADDFVGRYQERLDEVHTEIRQWLNDGLGMGHGRDNWIEHADRDWGIAQSHRPLANTELHRLRVAVMARYAELDQFLNEVLVEEFYKQICDALAGADDPSLNLAAANRAYLLGDRSASAREQIAALSARLADCEPEVPGLVEAVRRLSNLRFDFRMQSYPMLLDLHASRRPTDSGDEAAGYPPDFKRTATGAMFDWFLEEFIQFSYQIRHALQADSLRQFSVLSGAAMVFEDAIVRSGWSRAEFRNLVDGFRDELWPGRFGEVNSSSARAQRLRRATGELLDALNEAMEVAE